MGRREVDRSLRQPTEAGREFRLAQRSARVQRPRVEGGTGVDARIAVRGVERIVLTVRKLLLGEGSRQSPAPGGSVRVVPIREGPVVGTAAFGDDCSDDALEVKDVDAMPRQEEPRAVLAAVPERVRGRLVRAVHRRLVGPAGRIVRISLLHHADSLGVSEGVGDPRVRAWHCAPASRCLDAHIPSPSSLLRPAWLRPERPASTMTPASAAHQRSHPCPRQARPAAPVRAASLRPESLRDGRPVSSQALERGEITVAEQSGPSHPSSTWSLDPLTSRAAVKAAPQNVGDYGPGLGAKSDRP